MRGRPGAHGRSLAARRTPSRRTPRHTCRVGTSPIWTRTGHGWRPDGAGAGAVGVWVRVDGADRLAEAAAEHGLPGPVVERLRRAGGHGRVRPHVDLLAGGGVHLVAPTLAFHGPGDVVTGEVSCVVHGGVVLTAETGEAGVLDGLAARLGEPQALPDELTGGLLSALLATVVERAADVEDLLAGAVVELEDAVFSATATVPVEGLYQVKREIAEARRALVPLAVELPDLVLGPDGGAPADAWVRRLVAAVDRLDGRLADHDELCADMLSAHLALVSVAQNDQMRRISAWAATLAVPTLVGTVYGMNFVHMPELRWSLGYPLALALMAAVGLVVNLLFRRSGWL